jgi:hypothetical protein
MLDNLGVTTIGFCFDIKLIERGDIECGGVENILGVDCIERDGDTGSVWGGGALRTECIDLDE